MFAFALAVFLLIITPGPGVLSTAGVGAAYGWRQGLFYVAGLCAGTNLETFALLFWGSRCCAGCITTKALQNVVLKIAYQVSFGLAMDCSLQH